MKAIIGPKKTATMSEFARALKKWDSVVSMERKRGGPGGSLGDAVMATAVIAMMPHELEKEIWKKYHSVKTSWAFRLVDNTEKKRRPAKKGQLAILDRDVDNNSDDDGSNASVD